MEPKRENQPAFFDLAAQQRGSANKVLETIAGEVGFAAAEDALPPPTARAGGQRAVSGCCGA